MNTGLRDNLVSLFVETGHAHHAAFAATDGADPDWPIWYAGHFQAHLAKLLQTPFTTSQLIYCVMDAEIERTARDPERNWPEFYADHFIERFAPSSTSTSDKLILYHSFGCPYCAIVISAIDRLGLEVELREIFEDPRGRATVPVLRITSLDGEERWMPESQDIVRYLETTYT